MATFNSIDSTWYSRNVLVLNTFPTDSTKSSDRYAGKTLITDRNGQHIEFIQKRWFPTTDNNDTLVYIDSRYAYRPDIISVDYYNTPLYAWALLSANGLRSVWQLQAGMYIKLPKLSRILGGLN